MKDPVTIISDIDGTLVAHTGDITNLHLKPLQLLPGIKDKLQEWDRRKCKLILITGRRESTRKATEKQLSEVGIVFDQLIMGVSNASRVLINDRKPDSDQDTCFAINVDRNVGLEGVEI